MGAQMRLPTRAVVALAPSVVAVVLLAGCTGTPSRKDRLSHLTTCRYDHVPTCLDEHVDLHDHVPTCLHDHATGNGQGESRRRELPDDIRGAAAFRLLHRCAPRYR